MRDDLFAVLGAVDDDPDVRVAGAARRGPAFSTGGDLREFGSAPSPVVAREVRWRRDVWGRLLRAARGDRRRRARPRRRRRHGDGAALRPLRRRRRRALRAAGDGARHDPRRRRHADAAASRSASARALDLVLTGRWLDARGGGRAWGSSTRVVPRPRLDAATRWRWRAGWRALDPRVVRGGAPLRARRARPAARRRASRLSAGSRSG